jgi:hypothetical protein
MYESQTPEAASTPQVARGDDADDSAGRVYTVSILTLALALRTLVLFNVIRHYSPSWFYTRGKEMGWLAKSLLGARSKCPVWTNYRPYGIHRPCLSDPGRWCFPGLRNVFLFVRSRHNRRTDSDKPRNRILDNAPLAPAL